MSVSPERASQMIAEGETALALLDVLGQLNESVGELAAIQSDALVSALALLPYVVGEPGALGHVGDAIEHCRRGVRVLEAMQPVLVEAANALRERAVELRLEVRS